MYQDVEHLLPFPLLKELKVKKKKSVFHIRYFFSSVTKSTKSPFLEPHSGCEAMKTLLHYITSTQLRFITDSQIVRTCCSGLIPDNRIGTDVKLSRWSIQESAVVGVWGAVEQEEAEVKYHSCLTLMFPLVPQAHGDLVIYGNSAGGADQNTAAPFAAHKHVYTRLTRKLRSHTSSLVNLRSNQRSDGPNHFSSCEKVTKRTLSHFVWCLLWISLRRWGDYVY